MRLLAKEGSDQDGLNISLSFTLQTGHFPPPGPDLPFTQALKESG